MPENLRRPLLLPRDRVSLVAPDVVGVDGLAEMCVVVAVGVKYDLERQAHADVARGSGIAGAEPGHGEHLVRQLQYRRDRIGMITQSADRATAETRSLGRQ